MRETIEAFIKKARKLAKPTPAAIQIGHVTFVLRSLLSTSRKARLKNCVADYFFESQRRTKIR